MTSDVHRCAVLRKAMVAVKKRLAVVALLLVAISGLSSSQFEGWPVSQGGSSTNDSIDFGDVAVSQTATARYTFKVLETSQTSVRVTFHDPCSPFGFSGLSSRGMTLAPGQSVTFDVTFTPPKAQPYTCSFVVHATGGYPVQETETVVRLSGRGVTSAEGPSETPGSVVPGLPIGLPLTDESPDGISGTTDSDGKFNVTASPTTTVTGKLTECDGPPLGDREFRLAPVGDGYEIEAPGYEVVAAEPVESISFMGMESIDLGEICLEPVPEEIVEPPTGLETEEAGGCPCCSIIVEARMCCNPKDQYVETDTIYEPQRVRIRVAYCEPPEELGDVDLTPLPLTNKGGVLVNPGLAPSGPSMPDPSQVGVTSVALNGESLFEGDGEFEKTVQAGSLKPGTYTVQATIGRFDGEECVCEKTFEVLACPEVDAKLERTLDPENGCAPVKVTYDLHWPGEMDDICDFWYCDNNDLPGSMQRISAFPTSGTYSATDERTPRTVEPEVNVTANNCCRYDIRGKPFTVKPPVRCECRSLSSAHDCKRRTIRYSIDLPEDCRPITMGMIDATNARSLWGGIIRSQAEFESLSEQSQRNAIENEGIIGVESGQEYTHEGRANGTKITIMRREGNPSKWVLELSSCCHTLPTLRISVSCPFERYVRDLYVGLYFDEDDQYVVYGDVSVDGTHLTRENFNSFFEDCSVPYCDFGTRSDVDSLASNGSIRLYMQPDTSCKLDLAEFRKDLYETLADAGCFVTIPVMSAPGGYLRGIIYTNRCTPEVAACIEEVLKRHTDCKGVKWTGRQITIVPET